MIVGYDPQRVAALAWMCRQALWSLQALTSSDPAAANAVQAVRRLHRTIETSVLATADDIIRSAPLTRSFGGRAETGAGKRRRREPGVDGSPTTSGTAADLFHDLALALLVGALALLSDDELLLLTRSELTSAAEASRLVDIDDTERLMRSTALGIELSRRAAENAEFAERLVEYSHDDPMLALVVAESDVPAEIKIAVFAAAVSAGPGRPQHDHVRDRAAQLFLEEILDDPELALAAIGWPRLVADILDWGDLANEWVGLGVDDAVDLVDVAFSSPATYDLGTRDDPGDSEVTARALAALVDLMNSEHGDRGLPAELSAAYTAGLVPLLPRFVNGFDGDEVFRLRRDDMSPIGVELGATSESMIDLFGGLARHADSRTMLVGSVPALGPGLGTLYTAEQLAGFAAALGVSMANEQHEEVIRAERQEERWNTALSLLEAGIESSGVVPPGAGVPMGIAFDVARWSVDRLVSAGDLGLDQAPRQIEMLLVVALTARLMSDVGGNEDDDQHFGRVETQLTRIDEHLSSASFGATDISGEIDLLRDLVDLAIEWSDLDAATRRRVEHLWSALDDDTFRRPPFRNGTGTDLDA